MTEILWNGKEVLGIINGHGSCNWFASGISIDTRTLNKGDIFFALPGLNNDGNNFIEDALNKGACAAISNRPSLVNSKKVIFVNDVYKALNKLANYARQRTKAKIIGITGSSGKTTLKEMISSCLVDYGKVHKSERSFNNHIGVPLSLARMPIDDISRMGVSQWIRSLLYYEHRNNGILIPRRQELENKSSDVVNEAIIKDKKFRGGLVVEPEEGIHFDVTVMEQTGVKVKGLQFDTMIAAHVGGRRNIGLKELTLECFGVEMTPITDLIGKGKNQITMAEVPIEKAAPYAAADADFTQRLYSLMKEDLENKYISRLFEEVEIPLIPVLVHST